MFPLLAALALAACDGGSETTAGGVTADEARALDDAAEMIEARRMPDAAVQTPIAPQSPAPQAPAPQAPAKP